MTTPAPWHVSDASLTGYLDGGLDALRSASVEQHLNACVDCRTRVRPRVDLTELESGWTAVRDRIESPPRPAPIRLAEHVGLGEPTAILLTAAASLRLRWVVGAVLALAFAVAAALLVDDSPWPFLLLAPLVPVIGVAAAFADEDDATEALPVVTAFGRPRLVAVRTLAVVVSTVPAACLLGLFLPGPFWLAVAWLGPACATLASLLALAVRLGMRSASAVVAIAWTAVVVYAQQVRVDAMWSVEAPRQLTYAAVAAAALAVVLVHTRRHHTIGDVL